MIFTVCNKHNGEEVNVYHVRIDKTGYPHFLVYTKNGWRYMSAKNFKPWQRSVQNAET